LHRFTDPLFNPLYPKVIDDMKLLHIARAAAVGVAFAVLSGCAHNITISGDSAELMKTPKADPIDKVVGLVITEEQRNRDVTTPGGGGDKVTYKPYRDLEFPIYLELSRTYKQVVKLDAMPDESTARSKGINYVVAPEITTDSSSASMLTWPPTDFSVTLVCTVTDPAGKLIAKPEARGSGHAEFSEFKRNLGLSAQRATNDAVSKLPAAMKGVPALQ
jgi:hypothetical protein